MGGVRILIGQVFFNEFNIKTNSTLSWSHKYYHDPKNNETHFIKNPKN